MSAARLSQILDVAASLRDLCSTFPILREIEFEAVSLNLPPSRLPEIRGHIGAVVEIVDHSDGVTENGRAAIDASAENIEHQRSPADEAKQSAYFLVDFAEFTRSGLRHLRNTGGVIRREAGEMAAESYEGIRRAVPKAVEIATKTAIVGGVGGLIHHLGGEIAALGGMFAAFGGLNGVLQHMTHSAPEPPTPPDPAPIETPTAANELAGRKIPPSRSQRKRPARKPRKT